MGGFDPILPLGGFAGRDAFRGAGDYRQSAFFVRIRARRGHQIAAVAVARKLTVLCWHLLTKGEDYQWARPALVATKTRAMQLQAGQPRRAAGVAQPMPYNIKALRDREMYERFVAQWKPRRPKTSARAHQLGKTQ